MIAAFEPTEEMVSKLSPTKSSSSLRKSLIDVTKLAAEGVLTI
jgi:hypothetical protein